MKDKKNWNQAWYTEVTEKNAKILNMKKNANIDAVSSTTLIETEKAEILKNIEM